MTPKEKEVITQAFNMAFSVVAGDWRLPEPMNVAINRLQDAVFDLAAARGIKVQEGCSKEFLEYNQGYWRGVEESIRRNTERIKERTKGDRSDR